MRVAVRKSLHAASGEMVLEAEFRVRRGELLVITGPSGGGKTTLLRMIAGLLRPDGGRIAVGKEVWVDSERRLYVPSQLRRVGMVFQEYALFPNMTVRENLDYALPPGQGPALIEELIAMMEIRELVGRHPAMLSGGQQQRVAVARALVRQPRILLLDEPLSALDPALRNKLQDYILRVHHRFGLTTLMVSHDLGEISKMAHRVLRLDHGRLRDLGPPALPRPNGEVLLADVESIEPRGDRVVLHLRLGLARLQVPVASLEAEHYPEGARVRVYLHEGRLKVAGLAK